MTTWNPWGAVTLSPTVVAGTPFTVSGDLTGDGLAEVVLVRPHPAGFRPDLYNGTQSSSVTILSFSGGQPVDITAYLLNSLPHIVSPSGVFVADYNRDGRNDLFVADTGIDFSPWSGGKQHVFLSGSNGSLTPISYGPENYAHAPASADIDNDGDHDLFVGGGRKPDDGPYFLINDGAGNFTTNQDRLPDFIANVAMGDGFVHSYASTIFTDANRDGFQDLVLLPSFDAKAPLLLLNDGTGSFANSTPIELPSGVYGPGSAVANPNGGFTTKGTQNWTNTKADLNNDGYEDLILAQTNWDSAAGIAYAGGRLQILLNNQGQGYVDGSHMLVGDALPMANGTNYFDPHVADLNGDGWKDLVVTTVTNWMTYGSRVYMNDGSGRLIQDKLLTTDTVLLPTDTDQDGTIELVRLTDKLVGSTTDGLGLFSTTLDTLNLIYGWAGNDVLGGGAGADYMKGGFGNDIYYVDALDIIGEVYGQGTDTVYVRASYALNAGAAVEVLRTISTSGKGSINLYGNEFANTIYGNAGTNRLDGKGGADKLYGYGGNDIYYVDNSGDRVVETSKGGTADVVYSNVNHTLATYVERLYGAGSSAINLTGNSLANVIKGNAGANKINGSTGKDTLYGGSGKDTFVFTTKPSTSNYDKIADYNVTYDTIWLDNKCFTKLGSGLTSKPKKLASSYFRKGSEAHDSNDRVIYDSKKGYLYYDADGTGVSKQVVIATLSKNLKMTYHDFYVI